MVFWVESNKEYIFITEVTLLSSAIYLPFLSCILIHILLFLSLIMNLPYEDSNLSGR